jgi:hypothetical protein
VAATTSHRAEEDDPMRRRELLGAVGLAVPLRLLTTLDDALALLPAPALSSSPTDIAARLACARKRFGTSDLTRLIADLPDLLAVAHEAADQDRDLAAHARLAACYDLATETLNKIGRYSSRITADRATTYAALSGSPIAMATSARALGIVLRHEGRQHIADKITLEAVLAAARLPDHPVGGRLFTVTPAQVTLYRVGVHWSLGDAGAALHAGRGLHPTQFPTPERRGRLHTDMARAWWQWGKPEQTAHALLDAHRQAPAEVRDRPAIRKIVTDLATQHPRATGVHQLATIVGHRALSSR